MQNTLLYTKSISTQLKKKMLSVSSAPLKLTTPNYSYMMSFNSLHNLNKRATPTQITLYKHVLILHKLYNTEKQAKIGYPYFPTNNLAQGNPSSTLSTTQITKLKTI